MHIEVVDGIFYFTQNIGCSEDIVTGALATMFYYCPSLQGIFLKNLIKILMMLKNEYYVETGRGIYSKKYTWLKKDINFRPDIIISNSKDDWDEKKKPENEQKAIIIETKLFGSYLLEDQETLYSNFKSQFSKIKGAKLKLMLISIKDYNSKERHHFI